MKSASSFLVIVAFLVVALAAVTHTSPPPPPTAPVTVAAPAPVVAPKPRRYSQESTDKWLESCNERGQARLRKAKRLSDQTKWMMRFACACGMDLMEDKGESAFTRAAWSDCVQQSVTVFNEQVERHQRELAAKRTTATRPSRGREDDYDRGEEDGYNDAPRRGNSAAYREGYEDGEDEDSNGNLPGEEGYQEE
jgi:hypothetical protein